MATSLSPLGLPGSDYGSFFRGFEHPAGAITQLSPLGLPMPLYGSFAGRDLNEWVFQQSGALRAKGEVGITTDGVTIETPTVPRPTTAYTQLSPLGLPGGLYGNFVRTQVELDLAPPVELNAKGVAVVTGTIGYGIQWPLGNVGISAKGGTALTGTVRYFELGMFALDVVSLSLKATPAVTGDVFGVSLNYGDIQAIAERVWKHMLEDTMSAEEIQRIILSVLAGKVAGAQSGVETFRDVGDTKDRVTVTVDKLGNRNVVVLDPT